MKNIYKIAIILLLIVQNSYSQSGYSHTITEVRVNNVLIPNGAIVDMGTNSSVNIKCKVVFTKPSQITLGNVDSMVFNQNDVQLTTLLSGNLGPNNVGTTDIREFTLNADHYPLDGTGYFVAKCKQTTGAQLEWISNKVYIRKSPPLPTFGFNPSNIFIPCNDMSVRNFNIGQSNIPSGATVTYQWNYSGWIGNPIWAGQSDLNLTPASGNVLPSNVSVTPFVNGTPYPPIICYVYRATFTSNAAISGLSNLCTGSTSYTISNAGTNAVSWSSSNTALATISNPTATGVTLTKVGAGSVNLIATLTNSCGQTTQIIKTVIVGSPILSGLISGPTCVKFGQTVTYTFNGNANYGGTAYQWTVDAPIDDNSSPTSPLNCSWKSLSTQGTNVFKFKAGCIQAGAVIRVHVVTNCGNSNYSYLYVNVNTTGSCYNRISNVKQDNGNYVSYYIDEENNNELVDKVNDENSNYLASIYDINGIKVKEFRTNNYNVSDLKSGIYILKLNIDDAQITSKFIVN